VNKRDLTGPVCAIAKDLEADVIVLLENKVSTKDTLHALRTKVSDNFVVPSVISDARFHCFCRESGLGLDELYSAPRISARRFCIGGHDAMLVLVHGVDMRNYDTETRQSNAQSLANEVALIKEQYCTNRVILIGDFNMNPYERGMNLAAGLNAMMTKACVRAGKRTFLGQDYDYYYNPMWSLFGDNTEGPAGTVYDTSNQGPYGWSMLDQVLFSHTIVPLFAGVRIVTTAGSQSLMDSSGRPDSKMMSDHFPIMVALREDYND
jgi:endonuclease/exonuclease/phosphatase (EEP) superfamily protein YafD